MRNKKRYRESFYEYVANLYENRDKNDIMPPEIEYEKAIHFLCNYLLGEDWYISDPVNGKQANTIIADSILWKYSKRYRKEVRKMKKIKRGQRL